ncbi:hypothetical protein HYZ98_02780 [Candidatus Peregrinibacteria bacterium]|nr:hypothetical protein [Candidatus Peregrinibacteria bacterium]
MTVYRTVAGFLALTILTIPLSAQSAGMLEVLDTIAGLPTEVILRDIEPHKSVTGELHGPGGNYTFSCAADANGTARCDLPGHRLTRAGTYTISVQESGTTGTFNILPDRIDPRTSSIVADPTDPRDQETQITVTLMDQYRNPLAGRLVELLSTKQNDAVQTLTHQTDETGVQRFSLVASDTGTRQIRAVDILSNETLDAAIDIHVQGQSAYAPPQAQNVRARDQAFFAESAPSRTHVSGRMFYGQVASFDVVDHFEVTIPSTMVTGVEAQKIVIRAVDRRGNTVEDYVGTIVFSSTDPFAALPAFGEYVFRDRDLGVREFPLSLKFQTPGEQTFRTQDKTNPDIFGEASVVISGSMAIPPERKIIITSHKQDQAINTTNIVLQGKAPPFINLMITGGQSDVMSETDATGLFSAPLSLPDNQRDFTIRVRDEAGQHDSGSLHLVLDTDGPAIHTVSFSPERPEEGSSVLVIVESEPNLVLAMMTITETDGIPIEINLSPAPSAASGSYQAVFQAPAAGTYQPMISVVDTGGNSTELRTMLTVELVGLKSVENLRATPLKNAVALEWDPCEDVDGYRIYVGENPDDFLYSLDTGRPTTKATVSGLLPGKKYYFAVTCLIGDTESETKKVVEATVPGLVLTITPQDASLLIEWPALPTDIPLDSYLLEYGIEPANLTERRNLHGALQAFTLHDLLNDITYYLRLTPVSLTGDILKDMAASGQGIPHALIPGFRPRPADAVPFSRDQTLPLGASVLPRAPYAHPTGIPTVAWIGISIFAVLSGLIGLHRYKVRQEMILLAELQRQYR